MGREFLHNRGKVPRSKLKALRKSRTIKKLHVKKTNLKPRLSLPVTKKIITLDIKIVKRFIVIFSRDPLNFNKFLHNESVSGNKGEKCITTYISCMCKYIMWSYGEKKKRQLPMEPSKVESWLQRLLEHHSSLILDYCTPKNLSC